jgi:hypothetical protein
MLQLLQIPAAQELDSGALLSLLTTAVQQDPGDDLSYDSTSHELSKIIEQLCRMPGAKKISVEEAEQLMRAGKQPNLAWHAPCKSALMNSPVAWEVINARAAALAARMGLDS